jgi:hypothetical protein
MGAKNTAKTPSTPAAPVAEGSKHYAFMAPSALQKKINRFMKASGITVRSNAIISLINRGLTLPVEQVNVAGKRTRTSARATTEAKATPINRRSAPSAGRTRQPKTLTATVGAGGGEATA